jgi:hypothetical protein
MSKPKSHQRPPSILIGLKNNITLMKSISSYLSLLVFFPSSVFAQAAQPAAGPQVFWSEAGPGKVKVQVQNFAGDVAPLLNAYPMQDEKSEPVAVPALKPMSEVGFWENPMWDTSKIKPGIYLLSDKAPVADASLLNTPGNFQTLSAQIMHQEGTIQWQQSVPGAARVLLQSSSGLLIGSPADWMITGPGKKTVKWDGKGADGLDYRFQPGITAVVQVAELHKELLIVGDTENQAFVKSTEQLMEQLALPTTKNLKLNCKALSSKGVVQSACEPGGGLKVEFPPETIQALRGKRYEILIYIDGVFIQEEAQGVNPYVYRIPATVASGAKTISINLVDYEGASGIVTLPFISQK